MDRPFDRLDDDLFTLADDLHGRALWTARPDNKAAILGIPFDCGTNMRIGARGGPDLGAPAIGADARASTRPTPTSIRPRLALDWSIAATSAHAQSKIVDAFERTEQAVDRIVAGGRGAPSPSAATARSPSWSRAPSARSTLKMAALHIDLHTDSYPYGSEEKYNSATQFTHVAEEGLVDPEFSWHVGIRSTTYAQGVVPRAMSLGYKVVSIDELIRGGFAQRMAEFRDKVG